MATTGAGRGKKTSSRSPYSQYSTKKLEEMAAQNSAQWHGAGQAEQDALHRENVEINKVLDSRKGTSSSFDRESGQWSSSGGGQRQNGSGSDSSGTPDYLKDLTGGQQPAAGSPDYSVLLRAALDDNDYNAVNQYYWARQGKIAADPSLSGYAYDEINREAADFLNNNQPQSPDVAQILGQLNSVMSQYSMPEYSGSEWDATRDALARAALAMNYEDWTQRDQYSSLADRYGQQGEMSMRDVMGQVMSRTGGLASSYAQTAAQQQYNQYMSQLEEVARQMYAGERSEALQNAQLAGEYSDRDYDRYLDRLAQYNNDRGFGFDILSQVLQNSRYNQEWQNTLEQQAYQRERDQYNDSLEMRNEARDRVENYFAIGGTLDELYSQFPDLITASGLNNAEMKAMEAAYQREMAAAAYGGGSGGSRSSDGSEPGGNKWDGLIRWVNQYGENAAESYIRENYKDLGYSTVVAALAGWENYQTQNGRVGKTDTYQSLMNSIDHINPGTSANIAETFGNRIQAALDAGTLTESEADKLLRRLGY